MLAACVGDNPATRDSSADEAVPRSTPTALTQSSTVASRLRASALWETSCWYCPTPIAFGSILTSSASGSCRRRAIETAPRIVTSSSGNSRSASSEAEYTDAPASETSTFVMAPFPDALPTRATSSPASFSVSRLAVPLPTAISSTACDRQSAASVSSDSRQRFLGGCGYTVA